MKHQYQIIYDLAGDMWNWWSALHFPSQGLDWADNLTGASDKKIAKQIKGLEQKDSRKILKPHLLSRRQDGNSRLNKFMALAESDFADKYVRACELLEKITGHPMVYDEIIFVVTTFPRSPYFYDDRKIFMHDSTGGKWGMPIDGFLHEGLHFQLIRYWREDKSSPVSQLDEDSFDYLNEALTVVLDEDLKPVLTVVDAGYASQASFRKVLHAEWKKHHNFARLVDFGLEKLPEFVSAAAGV
jgi:hypothetical protein